MTGIAAIFASLFLGQAPPPTTMADWRAKWMNADNQIVLDYTAPPPGHPGPWLPYEPSNNLCQFDLLYVMQNGGPGDAFAAAQTRSNYFIFTRVGR